MARHFQDLEIGTEEISFGCLLNEEVRFDRLDFKRESKVPKEIAIRNHGRSERVTSDLGMKLPLHFGNVLDVIDVPVC